MISQFKSRANNVIDLFSRKGFPYVYSAVARTVLRPFESKPSLPPFIQIETTTRCNLRCEMCELTYWKYKGGDMTFDRFKNLVDEFGKYLKIVDLTGLGEGLLHKDFLKVVAYLKNKKIKVYFNDNFQLLNEDVAKELVRLGLDEITVSLDSPTPEVYEKIRKGAKFERLIKHIKQLNEIKKKAGSKKPNIVINTVITKNNLHEMTKLLELAGSLEIKRVTFTKVWVFEDIDGIEPDSQKVPSMIKKAEELAKKLKIRVSFHGFDNTKLPYKKCTAPWLFSYISYDGYVFPCCQVHQNKDREEIKSFFGNVFDDGFSKIWRSQNYNKLRGAISSNTGLSFCQDCPAFTRK